MKILAKSLVLSLITATLLSLAIPVLAYYPSLNVYSSGGSTTVTVSGGQPYAAVVLYYTPSGSSLQATVTGTTDGSGAFSTMVNSGSNISQIYATVAGQQVTANNNGYGYNGGCTYNCGSPYGLSLSQNNLNLTVGQSSTVTAYNSNGGNIYISSNSNSSVASASVSGNSIYIYGNLAGSTTISVCSSGSVCSSIYVTVGGSVLGANTNLWFSPGNAAMYVGQSLAVSINSSAYSNVYGGNSNAYYISSNSNSSVVSATVSGTVLNLYANTSGSSTISVCNSSLGFCGSLYVTVSGGGVYNNLTLSQTSVNLTVGQSTSITAYNSNGGSIYISSNSNSSVVSSSISGSVIYLNGLQSGSSTLSICSNNSQCASLYVTVSGTCYASNCGGNGSISFSQSSVALTIGQNSTVAIYGNNYSSSYYISSNSNSSAVSASISGSSLYLLAGNVGNATISVCQNSNSGCGNIYVTVSGSIYNNLTLSPSSLALSVGQSGSAVAINNNGYNVYVSSNSNSQVASYTVSGSTVYVYGLANGSTTLSICSNSSNGCASLYVTVGNGTCGYYGCGGNVALSQSTANLTVGQSTNISITGGGYYTISTNSSPTVASAVISGSNLTVNGQNPGNTTLTICQNGTSTGCASLYVIVSGYGYGNNGYYNNGGLSLSQSNVSLSVGQTMSINATYNVGGYNNNIFISSNTNPGIVSATAVASNISVYGIALGSSTIQVCASNNVSACSSLYVTVSGYSYNNGSGNLQYPGGSNVLGASTYASGQLISENGTVYIVYRNTKTGFASSYVFSSLGFKFSNVANVGISGLPDSGYTVSSAYASHPWGTWVKDGGNTIYFVQESGLIPVPDWSTFVNNGGQAAWVVRADAADFRLPMLSPMVAGDSRLK